MSTVQFVFSLAIAFANLIIADPTTFSQHPLALDEKAIANNALFSLHRNLVEIPSVSDNEHGVGEYLTSYLITHNFTVEKQPVAPFYSQSKNTNHKQRYNLLAYPSTNATRVLLTAQYVSLQCTNARSILTYIPLSALTPFPPTSPTPTIPQPTRSLVAAPSTQKHASPPR